MKYIVTIVADIDGVESQFYTSDTVLGVEGSKVCLQKLGWIEVTRLVRLLRRLKSD